MKKRWIWWRRAGVAIGVVGVLAICGGCIGQLRAARLLRDVLQADPALADDLERWVETIGDTVVDFHGRRDRAGELPIVVLVHGAHDAGARETRQVALARALALRGVVVACPDLVSLRAFRADPRDPGRLVHIARALADRAQDGKVTLLGISIGGSYCLVAAADPDLRERVAAVLALGAYEELEPLVRAWMVNPRDVPDLYDPFVEGRRRVFLGNVESLLPPEDHQLARQLLRALIRGEHVPAEADEAFSPAGRRLLAGARSTEPIEAELATLILAPIADELAALSPAHDGSVPSAPVFLLHGEADPIVPVSDAPRLAARLEQHGARVRLLVTDILSHVDAQESVTFLRAWPLLRFMAAFLRAAGM